MNRVSTTARRATSTGWDAQTPTVTGSVADGYAVSIDAPVDPTTKAQVAAVPMPGQGGPGGEPPEGSPGAAQANESA